MSLNGSVKSFVINQGYGFISCPIVDGDIYFNNRDVPPQLAGHDIKGRPVKFDLHESPDGKPQARNVKIGGGPPDPGAVMMMQGGGKKGGKGCGKGGGKTHGTKARASTSTEPIEQEIGQHVGLVKSYNQLKGWGFLECTEIEGDIYFMKRDVPAPLRDLPTHHIVGQVVTFNVRYAEDGKPQANTVAFQYLGQLPANDSQEPGSGNRIGVVKGTVKSYNADQGKGYGFLEAETVDGDIYFQRKEIPPHLQRDPSLITGQPVHFLLKQAPDGNWQGVNLRFKPALQNGTGMGGMGGMDGMGAMMQQMGNMGGMGMDGMGCMGGMGMDGMGAMMQQMGNMGGMDGMGGMGCMGGMGGKGCMGGMGGNGCMGGMGCKGGTGKGMGGMGKNNMGGGMGGGQAKAQGGQKRSASDAFAEMFTGVDLDSFDFDQFAGLMQGLINDAAKKQRTSAIQNW